MVFLMSRRVVSVSVNVCVYDPDVDILKDAGLILSVQRSEVS